MTRNLLAPCNAARRRRFTVRLVVLLVLAGWSFASGVGADSTPAFRVVVNTANPIGGANDELLTDLFLKRKAEWPHGESARPVDLKADSPTRREFCKSILHRSVAAVKNYWQQMIFSGRGVPPPELESDEAVIEYVTRHRGAVGYVSGGAAIDRVKAIAIY